MNTNNSKFKQFTIEAKVLITAAALMWLIHIINLFSNYYLNRYGILPRDLSHISGILFAPFLHGSMFHIIANSLPFVVLGILVQQTKHLLSVTLFVTLAGGLLVWLFGRANIHIGASGLIMGYFGFLLSHAYFSRTARSIIIAIVTFLVYGGLVFSLLDFRAHISFEGHLFGFITGVVAAWWIGRKN